MSTKNLSHKEYLESFSGSPDTRSKALHHALDIRKFEIELYWKRAAYFWTFIAADMAAVGVTLSEANEAVKTDLAVVLCCLGVVFSIGWLVANRGSKHWQENWENHVDLLEDDITGPLYKVILTRPPVAKATFATVKDWAVGKDRGARNEWISHVFTGPSQYSVSKVNQLISCYVSALWIGLLVYITPLDPSLSINWYYFGVIALTALTCASFFGLGRTYKGNYSHVATLRDATVVLPNRPQKNGAPRDKGVQNVKKRRSTRGRTL